MHFRLPFERVGILVLHVLKACLICRKGLPSRLGCGKSHLGWNIFRSSSQRKYARPLLPYFQPPYPPGKVDTAETSLLITEPYFNLPNIQEVYDQFVFEEYEFQSYFCSTRVSAHRL